MIGTPPASTPAGAVRHGLPSYLRMLVAAAPTKTGIAFALMVAVSLTEWVGLVLLVPLLALVGLDVQAGTLGRIAEVAASAFGALGLRPGLLTVLGVYVGVVGVRALLQRAQSIATVDVENRLLLHLRRRLYTSIVGARWDSLTRMRASDLLHALDGQSNAIGYANSVLLALVASVLVGLVYLVPALLLSPPITAVALLSGAGLLFLLRRGNRWAQEAGARMNRSVGDYLSGVTEHVGGLKLIKSYAAESRSAEIFGGLSREVARARDVTNRSYAAVRVGFEIGSVMVLSLLLFTSMQVLALSTAEVLLLLFLFARLVPRFSGIQGSYQNLVHTLPALADVMDLIDRCEREEESPAPASSVHLRLRNGIRFDQVSFNYVAHSRICGVSSVDLFIPAHRTTAIVGPSGAGKSTIADLVIGLLTPDSGRILIDGVPLSGNSAVGWRQQIGYVPQETFLFHDTVRANLLWARPDASDADLEQALEHAAASGFVSRLPAGIDTVVGDRGILLSGGERQRLALARALLRKPALLVLDEATSSLDSENERRIQRAVEGLHGRMTILIITHRLSTIQRADVVHALDQGRVVESGPRDVLLARDGRFAALCRMQEIEIGAASPYAAAGTQRSAP